jgi:uncharacterized membrane protein HdeD (DUF308 family)
MGTISENVAESAVEELKGKWGWLLTLGILMLILGFCAVSMPFIAALASVLFLGWLLIIGGILQGIHSFGQKHWGGLFWHLLIGILYLLLGVMLLVQPLRSLMALTLLLAIFFVLEGIFRIIAAFRHKPRQNWGWILVNGIVTLILGALIWSGWPSTAVWAIGLLVGIDLIFGGWSMVMIAMASRGTAEASAQREQTA